jgi:hypothetical protein
VVHVVNVKGIGVVCAVHGAVRARLRIETQQRTRYVVDRCDHVTLDRLFQFVKLPNGTSITTVIAHLGDRQLYFRRHGRRLPIVKDVPHRVDLETGHGAVPRTELAPVVSVKTTGLLQRVHGYREESINCG